MTTKIDLGPRAEDAIAELVRSGRYGSRDDVLREGVRLLLDREAKLAELDAKIHEGLADIEAGRVSPAEEVFAELRKRFVDPVDH